MVEPYPPRPYFESFNLWRTKTKKRGNTRCLTIVAGRQIRHASKGENDAVVYEPSGWLFIFGDYRHYHDGVGSKEVPLPRPVRIIAYSGTGYRAALRLQSLADCSTLEYRVRSGRFTPDNFADQARCPRRSDA